VLDFFRVLVDFSGPTFLAPQGDLTGMKSNEKGLGLFLALSLSACASSANLARPAEDTAAGAMGEHKCDPRRISGDSTPYSVDWSDDNRAALESAMSRGLAGV
jgi:hypothetical protein